MCKALREVNDAQVEFGLFRGCLSYNKINHLLRTCTPDLLQDALEKFDDHFQNIVDLASALSFRRSVGARFAGLGVNKTQVIAGSAYVGSCALRKDLVAELLQQEASTLEPLGVSELLSAHEAATGASHDFDELSKKQSVQQLLSTERHKATLSEDECAFSEPGACVFDASCQWLVVRQGLGLGLLPTAFACLCLTKSFRVQQ